MNYSVQVEEVSSYRRRLRITVPAVVVKTQLDKAYKDLKKKAKVPGFRPGHATQRVLEERFGPKVLSDVGGELIDSSYRSAVATLSPVGRPSLEESSEIESGKDFTFTVAVDVEPEVQVVGHKGLGVTLAAEQVAEDDVQKAVDARLARRARILEVAEDRGVQAGDFVLTEVKLTLDGVEVANDPGTLINTGAERFYPGIEALLLGLTKGAEATGEFTVGQGSALANLRGKTVQAAVKVLALQARTVPALDDESAKELGHDSAEAFVASVRFELQQQRDEVARNNARVALLQKLVELNPFDVPDAMVEQQLEALTEELKVRRAYQGEDMRSIRFSEAELSDLRSRARFAARAALLLAAVAKEEGIVVTEDDVTKKIEEIAASRQQSAQAIRGYLQSEGAIPMLRDRILEERTLEWLLENAEVSAAPAESEQA
ncbi:MAG: hypothetical protein RL071_1633 [Pseudomonadota bacterium]|jgi:trigger factor